MAATDGHRERRADELMKPVLDAAVGLPFRLVVLEEPNKILTDLETCEDDGETKSRMEWWERKDEMRELKAAAHKQRLALRAEKSEGERKAAAKQRQRARAAAQKRPWERKDESDLDIKAAKKQQLALHKEEEEAYARDGNEKLLSDAALANRLASWGWIPEISTREARIRLLKRFEKRGPVSVGTHQRTPYG